MSPEAEGRVEAFIDGERLLSEFDVRENRRNTSISADIIGEIRAALGEARADARHLLQYAPEAVKQTYVELRPWLLQQEG